MRSWGLVLGYILSQSGPSQDLLSSLLSQALTVELYLLLSLVGLNLGLGGQAVRSFLDTGLKVLVFPMAVLLGSLLGGLATSLVLGLPNNEGLAIASSLGWYSMGAALMMDAGYLAGGAICFLHCVMREFFSLVLIPLVAERVGYVEAATFPGAPAMGTCLPVTFKATQGQGVVYGFVSGTALMFVVPVLVPIFL